MRHLGDITKINGAEIEPVWRVYKLTSPEGLIYIGMTKHTVSRRIATGYKHNKRFQEAGEKFGWNNFEKEVLESNLSYEEAEEREKAYISQYKSTDPSIGYNISFGGRNTFEGLRHSAKTRQRMSEVNRGKAVSEETRRKLSESHIGKNVGAKNPQYGKPKSPETIQRQYDSHRFQMRPVLQFDMEGNLVGEYCSINSAARHMGTSKQNIMCCLRKKSKSCKGFVWKYKEEFYESSLNQHTPEVV